MPSPIKSLITVLLFLLSNSCVNAQDNTDYLLHGNIFSYCSYKKSCSGCRGCEDNRYELEIKNKQDKKITSIKYKIYSALYNHTEIKEAKIEGDIIIAHGQCIIYVCVPDIKQWYISEITYEDNTSSIFEIKGHLKDFVQETDECE